MTMSAAHSSHLQGRRAIESPRRRRLGLAQLRIAALAASFALALPASAFGWNQTYRFPADWAYPGSINLSAFNEGLEYNVVAFNGNYPDGMRLTLCNASYQCYQYSWWYATFDDLRSSSYGRAKCNAPGYNITALWVYHCYTRN